MTDTREQKLYARLTALEARVAKVEADNHIGDANDMVPPYGPPPEGYEVERRVPNFGDAYWGRLTGEWVRAEAERYEREEWCLKLQPAEQPPKPNRPCPKCGKEGEGHYVPPSMGEPGFYVCDHGDAEQPPEQAELPTDECVRHADAVRSDISQSSDDLETAGDPAILGRLIATAKRAGKPREMTNDDIAYEQKQAEQPPELPKQWKYVATRQPLRGELCWMGKSVVKWPHDDVEKVWPIVIPALPRPADQPGKRVTEWGPVRKGERVVLGDGMFWTHAEYDFPSEDTYGGYRWHWDPVAEKAEVRRWTAWGSIYVHDDVPLMMDGTAPPMLDRQAIARDEVVKELERLKQAAKNAYGWPNEVVEDIDNRIAELKEGR